jgi:hypothetical protein
MKKSVTEKKNLWIFIVVLVYIIVVEYGSKIEQIKNIDDSAYDILTADILLPYEEICNLKDEQKWLNLFCKKSSFEDLSKIPKVDLYLVDDKYLDNYNLKNYGYFFPRKSMNYILETLIYDVQIVKNPPKIIFFDFDFHYTELPFGRILSSNDEEFIQNILTLAKRSIVLLPKTENFHFIENYLLSHHINQKNILFVSPNFAISNDSVTRRFKPYDIINDKVYLNVDLAIYLLNTNKCSLEKLHTITPNENSINLCGMKIKKFDIVNQRFYTKLTHKYLNNSHKFGYTLWDKSGEHQRIRSISTLAEDAIVPESLENSTIIIGAEYTGNSDFFTIANSTLPEGPLQLSGVLLHLNTLNSLYIFNGQLQRVPLPLAIFIIVITLLAIHYVSNFINKIDLLKKTVTIISFIFIIVILFVFFFSIVTDLFFRITTLAVLGILLYTLRNIIKEHIKNFLEPAAIDIFLTLLSFILISYYLLFYYSYWFNWIVVFITYELYNLVKAIEEK